jgi:hypothetical protein
MRHEALTLLILLYNSMLDSGEYEDIGVGDVLDRIEDGTILRWLRDRAGDKFDVSLHIDSRVYGDFEGFYTDYLQALQAGYGDGRRKWGVKNKGLCLLIAWANEIIQQGSGWKPDSNVAKRA